MFLSDFANDDTVAKEYIVSVTATMGGQRATVATFYILFFRSSFTKMLSENWIGNILSYSITSSRFRIDIKEDTLPDRLWLTKDLTTIRLVNGTDYEAGIRSINFKLDLVTTDSAKSTTVDVRINIEDQNDEPPEFQKAVYDFFLLAGSKRNSVVGVVSATDKDTVGQTSFHLEGAYKDDFTINDDGILTSKVDLTRGRFPSAILFRVKAYDGVNYSEEANITVYLISYTSNAINLNRTFLGSVSENSPPGTNVADVAVSNYTGYKFANSRANSLFNLDLVSGVVTTNISLDRENNDHAYTDFTILAYMDSNDQCSPVTIGQLITTVTDVNDNAPTFSRPSYTGSVKENSTTGTLVDGLVDVVVTDDDIGENGAVNFALTGTGSNYFAVEKSNHNQFTIKTSGTLVDREVTPYVVLTLTGTDNPSNPQTGTTTLNITVMDINDNTPQFNPGTTVFSVEENAGPTSITTLTATDKDEGRNGQVSYSLVEGGFGLFAVDESTGAVSTVKEIDRENRDVFNLSIEARDQGSPSLASVLTITVNIRDVNDEKPTFSQTFYKGNYIENTPCTTSILTVAATDLDEGSNANIRFSTTSSNFTVDPTSGAIRCANPLDYEAMQQHLIEIKAENPGTPSMSDTVTVEINVKDVNDNSPRFDKTTYQSEITTWEWVTNNPVDVFEVMDDDSGTNGQFIFSMSGETDKFFIDGETVGVLRIKAGASQPGASTTYNFDVTATDKGSPPRSVSVPVSVQVKKIEGNSTVRFSSNDFRFSIVENQVYTTPFGIAKASHDPSVSVLYSLIRGGDFRIDPTSGELTCSRPQDREAAPNYTMVVRARDVATNASDVAVATDNAVVPLTATTQATIVIEDVNDNPPTFTETSYAVTVKEDSHMSTRSKDTGVVKVSSDLDYETTSTYECIVTAVDMYTCNNVSGRLTGSTTLSVTILDVNDNPPVFQGAPYRANISRDAGINSLVTDTINATDRDGVKDGNGVVKYHILSNTGYFRIDRDTGRIYVATALDAVNDDKVTLRIKATDVPQTDPAMETITDITISIITDQPRPFFKKTYTFRVKENEAPDEDKSVSIRAYVRRASEEECNCTYDVIDSSSFYIDSITGELRQREEVDREETGSRFYVTVKATDRHSLLYRTTDVEVIVEDVNDNLPYFNSTQQKFIVYQSAPVGYVIGSVMSLDPDLNSQPRYTTIPGDEPVELLGNGTLVVRASLLNYTDIRMVVSVIEDNFDGTVNTLLQTITQVYIEVRPDDHAPRFGNEHVTVMLVEGTRRGTPIADVRTIGSLGGYSNYDMETTDDTARALFLVTASGQVLCGQDMFLSDFANDDTVAKEYIVNVTGTMGGQKATTATFYILIFRSVFTTTIKENWIGNILSYSITSSKFRIDIKEDTVPERVQLANDLRAIRLVNKIDYEGGIRSIQFKLDLVTIDSTKSTTVNVRIKIEDPPKFKKAVYDFSLPAGAKRNSVVGVVDVSGGDTTGQTSFHLEGAYRDDFTINEDGIVTSKVDLTRGRFPSTIPLRVKASVGVTYSDEANITVYLISCTISAINLNKEFLGSVSENSPPETYVANVTVSLYTGYTFANPQALSFFNLDPIYGIVTTVAGLDRENNDQAYTEFNVQAYMDSGDQCSTVTIGQLMTNVTDVNDNTPTFSRLSYTGRVKENSNPGTLVDGLVDVAVTDDDIGENGVVNFALTGTGSNYFAVEKSNHNQFTIKTSGIRIDREETPYVLLTLTGTDNPSNPQTGTTTLNITVMDINDNTPQFNPRTTVFSVEENAGPTSITSLTATDEDEGRNGQVSYTLVEGGFGLFEVNESTGAVSTVKEIDRENRKVFNLDIQARDQGSPSLESVTTITVNIHDVNDEMPTFTQTFYKSNYTENAPCTRNILTVAATDLDEGSNANIRFSTTSSNFTVDPTSGTIRCANPLDYEAMQQHLIEIKAENLGTPSMSDTVQVEINVEDVNDNSPRFDKTTYQSEVTTWKWGTNNPVDVFEVTDDDSGTNGQLIFSMSRGDGQILHRWRNCRCVTHQSRRKSTWCLDNIQF
ncbi:protocadherin Fat 4-like [Haliotis rubra]|uniref:protocadherin Fat 4-like n=1 Tax=Haliotis rubra TaxID=36100 RepID=UPI001EE54549|nr:protocadherin Fat 4-like [Haliotis rubra]